ncbi:MULTISPECIES: type II secretion system protein GspM [Desulfococcus]|jgi:general secretion pathway protein M|uniref:General secretion pathway M protein n=1 Tax=Desulfococcus multivorans DSM 2059 TaxID=1121405 RepID=S7TQ11_DESML|nr:type II secretion system protein GspM [Desulfococcus multivorans]AOY57967.1 conserved uncharacterized protein [Desulfococcus multivorans]AQV00335.1 hypothetical protein B2D07_05810 [Desulfococcus multivorans]EPR39051.1 General secretion pathway M protein [Desulfococcus multivorans DSM 2059]MDX9818479.1 type II secretion system protein GspM [Desulfococcus multivorans]SJZ64162.1 general secretion pathway protein M [Desulfococcus multivorans DSM 2059]
MNLNRLSKRERYAVYAAAVFLIVFVAIEFIIAPIVAHRTRLETTLRQKQAALADMKAMKLEYESLKNENERFKQNFSNRPQGFTLFSFLDQLAGEARVKDNIAYMKPSKSRPKNSPYNLSMVELKLQGIGMKQLTPYLHMVETSKNMVFIRRISITKAGTEGMIDVILQVETFEA